MADDGALQLDKVNSAEIKRTRSGRACLPRLAFWAGERLFTSLNNNESPLYIPPKQSEKSNASYITPTTGLQVSMRSSAPSELIKSSKRTTRKQNGGSLKRLNLPNKHASNKGNQKKFKEKKSYNQPDATVKTNIARLKGKKNLRDRRVLTLCPVTDSQSDNLNSLQKSKKSRSTRKTLLSEEFTSPATRNRSLKQSILYSSNGFLTSSSKDSNCINNLNTLQSFKKKNVTWSDTETNSPLPKRNIFTTTISNARKLRSAKSTVHKSTLTNKQSNVVVDSSSIENGKLKSTGDSSDPDQDDMKPTRNRKVTRAEIQNDTSDVQIKRKSTRITSKLKKNKIETKHVSNENMSKYKQKKDRENRKPSSVKSQVLEPTKDKKSTLPKRSQSSESDEHLNTPQRKRCPKRKRLAHAIIDDTDSDALDLVASEKNSSPSERIAVSCSPEEDSLLLSLFASDSSNKPVSEVNVETAITIKDNIPEPKSTSFHILNQLSTSETASKHENIEMQHTDESFEEAEDNEASPRRFKKQSKKAPALSEKGANTEENADIQETGHLGANVTQCCIADLFGDSPEPKGRRKTTSVISKHLPKSSNVGKNAPKKHNKSWNNLKRDIDTQLDRVKRPAINPNMKIGDWHKRTCLRKEIMEKKIPKAGTLKGKKWLQKQLDELDQGHNDDYFANADLPNMKPLMKQLDTTEENSDLSLNFTTPRPKFPSDLYTRKLPSPKINESLLEFITNKNMANTYNYRREKRLKAKGSSEAREENGGTEKPEEAKASQSSTPPILTQESIKRAVQNVNDMLSRISAKEPVAEASYISSDELEDYYFDDP